jgi:RHS repeat-associated protein
VAVKKGAELSYVLQDHLGSTAGTVNSSGAVVSTVRYFPYGSTLASTGTLPTDKKFTGQIEDNTGLYYYNARYYDPEIGRFISADSIVSNPANPQSLNRYSYCLNNPLKYTDPSGHEYTEADQMQEYSYCCKIGYTGTYEEFCDIKGYPHENSGGGGGSGSSASKNLPVTHDGELAGAIEGVLITDSFVVGGASTLTRLGIIGEIIICLVAMSTFQDTNPNAKEYYSDKDSKLSDTEVDRLENGTGQSAEEIKSPHGKNAGKLDLYKKPNGDVVVKPKGGNGPGEPTGYNINDY